MTGGRQSWSRPNGTQVRAATKTPPADWAALRFCCICGQQPALGRRSAYGSFNPSISPSASNSSTTNHRRWSPSSRFLASKIASRIHAEAVTPSIEEVMAAIRAGFGCSALRLGTRLLGSSMRLPLLFEFSFGPDILVAAIHLVFPRRRMLAGGRSDVIRSPRGFLTLCRFDHQLLSL